MWMTRKNKNLGGKNMKVSIDLICFVERIREANLTKQESNNFFKVFLRSMDNNMLYALASDENTPSEIIDELAKGTVVRGSISDKATENPNISVETLAELAKEEVQDEQILKHPKTTADILEEILNRSYYYETYTEIARHPNASPKILKRLSKYDNYFLTLAIAENLNTDSETLDGLVKYDWNTKLMYAVINNPNVKEETLLKLSMLGNDQNESCFRKEDIINIREKAKKILRERINL